MLKFNKLILLLTAFAFLQSGVAFAQSLPQGKPVKWEGIGGGKNNEFLVFMPAGYVTTADGEYYLGKSSAARVEKQIKVARQINGVVLLMEFYQGKGKEIYKTLKEREKSLLEKEEEINGFHVARFSDKSDKGYKKTHFYVNDKSVYLLKAFFKSEDDKIVKSFFDSVRLVSESKAVAPNVPPDAKSTSLINLVEQEISRLEDSAAIDSKAADRPIIILNSPRPKFSFEARAGLSNIRVKLKVLYSSSGKVTDVEVLQITSKLLEKEAIETVKKTVFIPAEKDGKLVSAYQTVEFSFGVETR